jgi:hypothetical protein
MRMEKPLIAWGIRLRSAGADGIMTMGCHSSRWLKRAAHQPLICCAGTGYRGDSFRRWLPGCEPLLWPGHNASEQKRKRGGTAARRISAVCASSRRPREGGKGDADGVATWKESRGRPGLVPEVRGMAKLKEAVEVVDQPRRSSAMTL